MKSSLFWEGPIVPILYVLQTCASENTELIAEVVTVTEKAEGFVPLWAQKPPPPAARALETAWSCPSAQELVDAWGQAQQRAAKESWSSACPLVGITSRSTEVYPGSISSLMRLREVSQFSTSPWRRIQISKWKYPALKTLNYFLK